MLVATYNVENGRAVRSNWHGVSPERLPDYFGRKKETLRKIGAFLREQAVDVALLQEVDGGSPWTRGKPQLPLIREAGNFPYGWYVSCETTLGLFHQGNGIVSRIEAVDEPHQYRLPGGIETRGALEVRLGFDGTSTSFITTHLGLPRIFGPLSSYHRKQQFDFLVDLVQFYRDVGPVVVGGDFNTLDYGEMRAFLMATGLGDHFPVGKNTYHSLRLRHNFDYLLVSPELDVRNPRVANGTVLSDHLPVMADILVR